MQKLTKIFNSQKVMDPVELNKNRLRKLMTLHGKSSRHIAILLTRVTGDSLSARTVQSWRASADLVSARPCPGWVLYILENELQILAEENHAGPTYKYYGSESSICDKTY